MWSVSGEPVDKGLFGKLEAIDVLIEYDGPRTFTVWDSDGGLCLAHWLDDDRETMRFLAVPVTPKRIEQLKRGELTLWEVLEEPQVFVVDQENSGNVSAVWLTSLADLPNDSLPIPGTMLHRWLDPLYGVRTAGETIRPGEIPGSVIAGTVQGAPRD